MSELFFQFYAFLSAQIDQIKIKPAQILEIDTNFPQSFPCDMASFNVAFQIFCCGCGKITMIALAGFFSIVMCQEMSLEVT